MFGTPILRVREGCGMKRWILSLLVVGLVRTATAGGWSETYSLAGGTVSISNTQLNSSWVPVSVMIEFTAPGTGTVEVVRTDGSNRFVLSSCSFSNATTIVWAPDAPFVFGYGEALVIQSSLTNGAVQIIRRGD